MGPEAAYALGIGTAIALGALGIAAEFAFFKIRNSAKEEQKQTFKEAVKEYEASVNTDTSGKTTIK